MQHGSQPGSPTQTVHRVVRILKAFDGRRTLGIAELAACTDVPRSSVHRIVRALVEEQLLTQDADSRRYELSLGLAEFGAGILRSNAVRTASRPTVLETRSRTHESVHLGVLDHLDVVIIDTADSHYFVREVTFPGQRLPAHAISTGKVLLAHQTAAWQRRHLENARLPAFTAHTVVDPERLLAELGQVRAQGYAISLGELEEGVGGVAAPVFAREWGIAAAVSVGAPMDRFNQHREELIAAVCDAGRAATAALLRVSWA